MMTKYGLDDDANFERGILNVSERLEQVREIDGELAYEKMRRAVEKASLEKARLEWDMQETARQSRDRRGPERRGPERDFGPSR